MPGPPAQEGEAHDAVFFRLLARDTRVPWGARWRFSSNVDTLSDSLSLRMDTEVSAQSPVRRGGDRLQGAHRRMLRPARLSVVGPGDGYRPCALFRVGPAPMGSGDDCGPAQGVHLAQASGTFPEAQAPLRPGTALDAGVLCGNSRRRIGRSDPAIHHGVSGEIAALPGVALSSHPLKRMDIPAPFYKMGVGDDHGRLWSMAC